MRIFYREEGFMEHSVEKERYITIKNCNDIRINGVEHILGFDEKNVVLACDFGKLFVEGEDLKVESLSKANTEICITGKFKGVYFSEIKNTESVFKRMFKW